MNPLRALPTLILSTLITTTVATAAEPLSIGYSDWPGWAALKIGEERGYFREAGIEIKLVWLEYGASLDAFKAGTVDAVACSNGDMLSLGAGGKTCKAILVTDMSYGNDMVIGKAGVTSIKELKGRSVALEAGLVDHLLFLKALEAAGMSATDVTIVNIATNDAPKVLAGGTVDAVAAWYPVSAKVLADVSGSRPLFTSKNAAGLIYDVISVATPSLTARQAEWSKFVAVWPRIVATIKNPATRSAAVHTMAALTGTDPAAYEKILPGTRLMDGADNKRVMTKGETLESLFGSTAIADRFNLENKVYQNKQDPAAFIDPSLVMATP